VGKRFIWNLDKNRWLASHPKRAVCFEDIVASIETGGLLDDIGHSNSDKYPNQRMYIVLLNGYVFCVPYIEDDEAVFLKTAYPSRKFSAIYLTGDNHD